MALHQHWKVTQESAGGGISSTTILTTGKYVGTGSGTGYCRDIEGISLWIDIGGL